MFVFKLLHYLDGSVKDGEESLYSISVNITFKDQGYAVSICHLKLQVLREGKG